MNQAKDIINDFTRTQEETFSLAEFETLLNSGKQIRIKYGVDVTAPFLHIGHAVNLWMMRKLQDCGHKVVFLVGDFTTTIGDPTGKSKTRPIIPEKEIHENTEKFIEQAKMVLRFDDPNLLEIRKNSEWFGSMPCNEFLKLLSLVTHARLISRDMFKDRIKDNADIYMHEMVYPILQGYDSVMLESDLTIIGSDQLFNEMLGRFYQEKFGQKPQIIITTKITPGIDGMAKQSKSLGNYIGLGHNPRDKFGRTMRLPDNLIAEYLRVYTEVPLEEIDKIESEINNDPMRWKKLLASEIVKRYHGQEMAEEEQKCFEKTFSSRTDPDDMPELIVKKKIASLFELVKIFFGSQKSNNNIRTLFAQGAISLNGKKINGIDEKFEFSDNDVVKVGKRNWFRIKLKV